MIRISVIVPVRNEENSIRELLDGLINQTRRPDEIVITDGGSTDSTAQIIEDYIRQGAPVRLIRTTGALPGRGRNLAAAEARFDWLAFIDAGIRPEKNWLETLAAKAEQTDTIDVVYGAWKPVTDSFFKECAAIAYVPPPSNLNGLMVRPRSITSTLMRREAWREVKGFPEHLRSGEDLVFMNRVESAGFRAVFEPLAQVHWDLRPTLYTTFKRFVVYSRNNIRAGLWRQWQLAILSRYSVLIVLLLVTAMIGLRWIWIPFVCWALMLLLRAVVAIRRNRDCYAATPIHNLKRLLVLAPLISVLDAAAILGTIEWLVTDGFRRGRKAAEETNGA